MSISTKDDVQNLLMTLLSVWTGGFHSADWCQEGTACCGWSEKNIPSYITQALSSKHNPPPPPCPKYSPFSAVLKYNCALSALERVLTSALLTVLMAIFFCFTQMAKNSLPATPGGDTQLRGALDWTVGGVYMCVRKQCSCRFTLVNVLMCAYPDTDVLVIPLRVR